MSETLKEHGMRQVINQCKRRSRNYGLTAKFDEWKECSILDVFTKGASIVRSKDFVRVVTIDRVKYVIKKQPFQQVNVVIDRDLLMKLIDGYPDSLRSMILDSVEDLGKNKVKAIIPIDIDPRRIYIPDVSLRSAMTISSKSPLVTTPPHSDESSMINNSPAFNEFMIGSILNRLRDHGNTIHIPRTYDLTACDKQPKRKERLSASSYFIMTELIEDATSLEDLMYEMSYSDNLLPIIIQVLHTIYLFESKYKIIHGDLHNKNIIFRKYDDEWFRGPKGEKGAEYDFFEYKVHGKSLYIPKDNYEYVSYIIDFGLSCEYSRSEICWQQIRKGNIRSIVNTYLPATDYLFALYMLTLNDRPIFNELATTSLGEKFTIKDYKRYMNKDYFRLTNEKLLKRFKHDAGYILSKSSLFDKFRKKPPSNKRVLLVGTDE